MTTLKVTIGEKESMHQEAQERLAAAGAGEDLEDAQPQLNFEDYATMARLLSEANLALLEAIATHEPGSMREAADLVDRDIKDVHRNLTELESLGVIEFEEDGRSKRPVVEYEAIEIELPLHGRSDVDVQSEA